MREAGGYSHVVNMRSLHCILWQMTHAVSGTGPALSMRACTCISAGWHVTFSSVCVANAHSHSIHCVHAWNVCAKTLASHLVKCAVERDSHDRRIARAMSAWKIKGEWGPKEHQTHDVQGPKIIRDRVILESLVHGKVVPRLLPFAHANVLSVTIYGPANRA